MGQQGLPPRSNGRFIDASWFNIIKDALTVDFVPRSSSGIATNHIGSLGQPSYQFLKAFIKAAHFKCGDIKLHHSYNSAVPIGHGWMLCDGRQVTLANYETEHGSSTWSTYVGSSPLLNKYLPDMTGRFASGVAATTQDGSSPISTVGITGNLVDFSHNHIWAKAGAQSFDSSGNQVTVVNGGTAKTNPALALALQTGDSTVDRYTDVRGSAAINITLSSIDLQFYMRIF